MTDYETETPTTKDLQAFGALSKEEYARIHAPEVPKWFVQQIGVKIGSGRICTNQTHKAWLDYFVSVTVD